MNDWLDEEFIPKKKKKNIDAKQLNNSIPKTDSNIKINEIELKPANQGIRINEIDLKPIINNNIPQKNDDVSVKPIIETQIVNENIVDQEELNVEDQDEKNPEIETQIITEDIVNQEESKEVVQEEKESEVETEEIDALPIDEQYEEVNFDDYEDINQVNDDNESINIEPFIDNNEVIINEDVKQSNNIVTIDNSEQENNELKPSENINNEPINVVSEQENNNPLPLNISVENNIEQVPDIVVENNIGVDEQRKSSHYGDKFVVIILILAFISVCAVVAKTFYYGRKIDEYEDYIITIEKKMEDDIKIYSLQELDNKLLKKVAASELTSCLNTKLDIDKLPDSINDVIKEIKNYYSESNNHFSFAYKDIYTGFTVTYNENQTIFSASTIKAPTDIYVYEMASLGKINLDEELTYTPAQYVVGSGSIQYAEKYTRYKTRDLLKYSTVYSDNVAHNILIDNYGRKNMLDFWSKLGTTSIFKEASNWGSTNAHDAVIYMSELYRFYAENEEYGNALMNNFMNAVPKFIKGKNGYTVANKSGWRGSVVHDASIIFADNPYIIVALSNMGNYDYSKYFDKVNDLAYKLHTEYWKYKMELCKGIKQY